MSRTHKDAPWPIWQCRRLGVRVPADWAHYADPRNGPIPWEDPAGYHAWHAVLPDDLAIGWECRRKSGAANNALHEGRYRAYVRSMIRAGRWDDIEGPDVLTGYRWWY